ncbi:aerotolerance regulator BatA [Candidatus Saganbacteria bacterium CG08_land_8_20_14_0_20_45_16]|uniref:Aerotolerance regulator BatA n=1 Tax=Candidatus Saganbacteria bacterium CG08_land_8_20_14_0_20_45_16 TaxID=2014293 RepID=A0A2H0XUA6_UNCSA|nr:MAG: aerotolerance regulator BatA [Candidatus Saganbacteria bacterium CG08_land_8_20_14_0_20_45_16]
MLHFSNWYLLILLAGLPWLYFWVEKQKPATIPHPDLVTKLIAHRSSLKAKVPLFIRLATFALLIIALARPQTGYVADTSNRFGIDIMVALDISSSMYADDFKPNRITAAKEVLAKFIKGRPTDRIGLVVFGSKSYVQCPLTNDHDTLLNFLDQVNVGLAEDGTAIGMALANCVNRLKNSQAKSRVILLLTDGDNNAGEIDPKTAAKLAQAMGIKIYTIGIGDLKGAPIKVQDQFGRVFYARNPDGSLFLTKMNEVGLKEITALSEGNYFIASNLSKLNNIFDQINKLEKVEFKAKNIFVFEEHYYPWVFAACLLLIGELMLRHLFVRRIP